MKKIPLSYGLFATVSDEDYEWVNEKPWFVRQEGQFGATMRFYAEREIIVDGKIKKLYMHRVIMNPGPGLVVTHLNSDTLDNRRENLEIITRSESMRRNKARGFQTRELKRGKTRIQIQSENAAKEPRPFEKEVLQAMKMHKKRKVRSVINHKKAVKKAEDERGK